MQAINASNESLKFNPNNADVFYTLGEIYDYLEDDKKSFEYFSKAVAINPDDPYSGNSLALICEFYFKNNKKYIECKNKSVEACNRLL